jgi:hypothetical protein
MLTVTLVRLLPHLGQDTPGFPSLLRATMCSFTLADTFVSPLGRSTPHLRRPAGACRVLLQNPVHCRGCRRERRQAVHLSELFGGDPSSFAFATGDGSAGRGEYRSRRRNSSISFRKFRISSERRRSRALISSSSGILLGAVSSRATHFAGYPRQCIVRAVIKPLYPNR